MCYYNYEFDAGNEDMYFIIMDLEWNNTYGRKIKGFINEIIEIGAVMLDENLNEVETFSTLIKSQIGRKLRGRVRELTNLTNEDLTTGVEFTKAVSAIRRWIGNKDCVILTWGDSDIRVLIDNFRYLNGINKIPFLHKYANLQSFFQQVMKTSSSKQIGLATAAEMLGLSIDEYSQHRALDDSMLEAECFKRIYNKKLFDLMIQNCDKSFYEKLDFKPYIVANIDSPYVDKKKLCYICEQCNKPAELVNEWRFINRSFRAIYYCKNCKTRIKVSVAFKKLYDRVEVKKTSLILIEHPEDTIKNAESENSQTAP